MDNLVQNNFVFNGPKVKSDIDPNPQNGGKCFFMNEMFQDLHTHPQHPVFLKISRFKKLSPQIHISVSVWVGG